MLNATIRFFLENKLATVLLLALVVGWGLVTAPFDWDIDFLPRDPVPVDAVPDIGENQQIVFTRWVGRSPEDVEDQITNPLTTALLGLPGVKSVRSTSMFGLSFIAVIFDEDIEYYWSRSRLLEKLNALPDGLLPEGVSAMLGPDATALGQVYWYTLEGRDELGQPVGGWDLSELRTIQDFYVRPALTASPGVAEVASVGGFVKEYQVDLDPIAMHAHKVSLLEVVDAVRRSNLDVGANTIEINRVEYFVRGLGNVASLEDIEQAVVGATENVPVRVGDVAQVTVGPAPRGHGGVLDKGGAEAVGGVVIARYGANPLRVIEGVKQKLEEIAPGLPARTLADGRNSRVTVVPFYDRTGLIYETLGTLYQAINLQILITILVILTMVMHLRASLLISALLPLAVLIAFVMMRYGGVDANIVALSGIAIAIGTMVDLGIILSENILRHQEQSSPDQRMLTTVYEAVTEVSSAVLTAMSTTIVSFLPVFTLQAAEGKLFGPLAYTKTFALLGALFVTLLVLPALAHWLLERREGWTGRVAHALHGITVVVGLFTLFWWNWAGVVLTALGLHGLVSLSGGRVLPPSWLAFHSRHRDAITVGIVAAGVSWVLSGEWLPLGAGRSQFASFLFVLSVVATVLGGFGLFVRQYPTLLALCLNHKRAFLAIPCTILLLGGSAWQGFERVFAPIPWLFDRIAVDVRPTSAWSGLASAFPGIGKEFMPSLDEGSFLLMPTSMPHSGVEANVDFVRQLDLRVQSIPEVDMVVGKAGRTESALDPAPMSMFENIIRYKSEYVTDKNGYPKLFRFSDGAFVRDVDGRLIPDPAGEPFRQWRDHIKSPDDIWHEIAAATSGIPGVTSAPKLQPIETRLIMLQTGMRAPMGIKVFGPSLETIEAFGFELERLLKEVPSVRADAVFADRSLGKPYLELDLDRVALGRHGLSVADVQRYVEVAIGGMGVTQTIEGRERFNIRVRYAREWRDDPDTVGRILVGTSNGTQIPLSDLARVTYRPGPAVIRGEDTFLVGYVLLDKRPGLAEVDVVEEARDYLQSKIDSGELVVPPGVSYRFSGSYENQVRAEKRLAIVIPIVLAVIFLILYFQFRSTTTSLMIFSAVALAFAGGFTMLWLYSQSWFLDVSILGVDLREIAQVRPFNLSVAVWVGFIALFGIATDDGVVMATYLDQSFRRNRPSTVDAVRAAVLEAGERRVRPCLMTTATTLLALLPVLMSTGRGADIMVPMAIPAFGGMTVALITLFVVPVLYSAREETRAGRAA